MYAINTVFGWVIGGKCDSPDEAVTAHICCKANADNNTERLLKAFWESEDPPSMVSGLYPEEQSALDYFQDTVTREDDGRYRVRIPKKENAPSLGYSKPQAVRRYEQNYKTVVRKGRWTDFEEAVDEYSKLRHSELVPASDLSKTPDQAYYMPMHGVVKESSTTTKLRVVFDASAKTTNGVSLNETLISGPTLYPLLTNILICFRLKSIGMSADISKIFREVSLYPDDRDLHRYVTKNSNGMIKEHRMTRLTFGVSASPFLATQVLRQLSKDYQAEYPEASELVLTSFYVDDRLTGADTVQEAVSIRQSLNEMLSKGSMNLRKWRSNSPDLKSTIPEELLEKESVKLITAPEACYKALGVHWDTVSDTLHVATPKLQATDSPTK